MDKLRVLNRFGLFNVIIPLLATVSRITSFSSSEDIVYIFIPVIQSQHLLHLNIQHVNKHQTTQDTQKNTFTR